jgi:hypothetical protein
MMVNMSEKNNKLPKLRLLMHEKYIRRIVREQFKKQHPNWKRLAEKPKLL